MVPTAITDNLRLWVSALGGSPVRFYVFLVALLLLFASLSWWWKGPRYLPTWMLRAADDIAYDHDEDDGDMMEMAFRHDSEFPVQERVQSPEGQAMKDAMKEIREVLVKLADTIARPTALPSPLAPMEALASAASNALPEGPTRQTATRMLHEQPGGMGPPPAETQMTSPGYAPLLGFNRASTQAGKLLQALAERKASRSVNQHWAAHFWQDVTKLDASEPIDPDLKRALRGGGYQGPGTLGPPREALEAHLEAYEATGGPPHGAAGGLGAGWLAATVPPPGLPASPLPGQHSEMNAWSSQLPPDLPRAAPEIYSKVRASGTTSVQEWLRQYYHGDRSGNNTTWIDLWDVATNIDFKISKCHNVQEMMQLLATDDNVEIGLRRLAAEEFFQKTGDSVAATEMLANRAPGVASGLAPSWLVTSVATYSKAERQRNERVTAEKRGSGWAKRGRGDQRGGRGGGRGRDQQSPTTTGGEQRARGRGRGRA